MLFGSSGEKRIAFVSNSAWSVYNFRLDVIRSLMRQGYQVMVVATKDEYVVYLEEAGCSFVDVYFNNRTGNPVKDYFFYRKLRQVYKRCKPDFIFHYVTKPNIYGSLAAASLRIPSVSVITGLGYAFAKDNWLNNLVKGLYTRALTNVKQAWFLNNEDAAMFLQRKIVSPAKVKILPGEGVNTTYFSPAAEKQQHQSGQKPFCFLMSTRLLKSKGVAVYAEAVRILKAKGYALNCRVIGFFEPHHPDSLSEEDLQRWEAASLIYYDGFANDVRPHLEAADCFVFPSSYNEGIPRALLEAASMELPVITSRSRGCKEVVIENVTGYLCNSSDVADFADKMEKMICLGAEERNQMGTKGRAFAIEKFEISKVINYYTAVLKDNRAAGKR